MFKQAAMLCRTAYTYAVSCVLPAHCVSCWILLEQQAVMCNACYADIRPVISTTVALTATKSMEVLAAGAYQEPLRSLILGKHYGNNLASHYLGELVWRLTPVARYEFDYIVPIPLHWTRSVWRGFNQAEEIAQVLARYSDKPVVSLLRRVRRTASQATCSASGRVTNVHEAFALCARHVSYYHGARLLLVDDVMTTGATLTSAGRELLKLKPASLTCIVAVRTT